MQGEERCGKIAATSAGTAETFWVIDEISGRMSDQGQALDSSQRIGETLARTGGISGKIIGISGAKTGETCGTTWLVAEATAAKHLEEKRSRWELRLLPAFFCRDIFCPTGTIRHIRSSSSSITSAQVETGGRELTATARFVATSCSRP